MLVLDLNNEVIPEEMRTNRRRHLVLGWELSGGQINGHDVSPTQFAGMLGVDVDTLLSDQHVVRHEFHDVLERLGRGANFRSPNRTGLLEPPDD